MPRPTPFHSRMGALCKASRWEEWDGFLSPTMFDLDHLQEYIAVRTGCALFDVSPLYQYDVRGQGALADRQHETGPSPKPRKNHVIPVDPQGSPRALTAAPNRADELPRAKL